MKDRIRRIRALINPFTNQVSLSGVVGGIKFEEVYSYELNIPFTANLNGYKVEIVIIYTDSVQVHAFDLIDDTMINVLILLSKEDL